MTKGFSDAAARSGFSLVELSIVLVILGLLTGGILTGQNLIRAAELRSVTTQLNQYQTSVGTFRDKYFALPGDMTNATDFWGAEHTTPSTCVVTASTGKETCNGNGDGNLSGGVVPSNTHEAFRFWQHLANAGLIEGTYSGVQASANTAHVVIGENVPRSKVSNAGISIFSSLGTSGNSNWFATAAGHHFRYGADRPNDWNAAPVLTPEEAWNIDKKLDDGRPAYGNIFTWKPTGGLSDCTTTDVEATSEYKVSHSGIACIFFLRGSF